MYEMECSHHIVNESLIQMDSNLTDARYYIVYLLTLNLVALIIDALHTTVHELDSTMEKIELWYADKIGGKLFPPISKEVREPLMTPNSKLSPGDSPVLKPTVE